MIQVLRHYKWKKIIKNSGLFDVKYYLFTYPDVREADVDPVLHYVKYGWLEERNPSATFDTGFYLRTYGDVRDAAINPLVHYILHGQQEGRTTMIKKFIKEAKNNGMQSAIEKSFSKIKNKVSEGLAEIKTKNSNIPKISFDETKEDFIDYKEHEPLNTKLKTIAFYLPQFHPFPENDAWWGKGFTEWTNVTKAKPNFVGHYQPHLPIHNGFYDLRIPEVMIEQAKLARNYGIHGFNFYYYWFDGKILMHKPFEILLNHKEIDINFCITWANENWTRRWDGLENEVLIAQNHSEEDSIKFIHSLFKYFKDERYIRIDNKPVLIIYRSSIIPEIAKMGEIWREEAKKEGFDGLYLVCAQTTGTYNPNDIGFDAAMEFPPHTTYNERYSQELQIVNPNFQGAVMDYSLAATKALEKNEPSFKLFKTSTLSWDNTARRQDNSTIFHNFSIEAYKNWMIHLYKTTLNNDKYNDDEKLVFVNAWNEWAEGTHLEPDRKYGYAYLESTYKALENVISTNARKIIVVSHDAYPHGAQYLALNIGMYLKYYFKYEVAIIINGEGSLKDKFKNLGNVYFTKGLGKEQKNKLFKGLFDDGFKKAVANTSVVGDIVEDLNSNKIEVLSLIHEMKSVIENNNLQSSISKIKKYANEIIFPSEIVKTDFEYFEELSNKNTFIKPQGLFRKNRYKYSKNIAREKLINELNIDKDSKIILNIAYGDHRKGIDLFAEVGKKLIKEEQNIHFVWVGHFKEQLVNQIIDSLKKENINHNFHFVGIKEDIDHYYAGSDIFFLSSREDPFPSVVLDAMNVGLPVVAFDGAGGFKDIILPNCGLLVNQNDLNSAAKSIFKLLDDTKLYNAISINSIEKIENDFSFTKYLFDLLELQNENIKKVSVIIPNYNYERYIKSRLETILNQTYPIYEIIYLDDNSSDNSLEIAQKVIRESNVPFKIIKNEKNSGSVFKQWAKGISQAGGDYLWIAESDDLCENDFLEKVIKGFDDKDVELSYCQSKMIDENDKVIAENYFNYTNDISTTKWKKDYINDGLEELKTAMVVKNTIPNVSSVVFKKFDLEPILEELCTFKVAGDWYFYTYLLEKGKIAYCSESLNMHRRHENSVTVSKENNEKHFNEIVDMQNMILNKYDVSDDFFKITYDYRASTESLLLTPEAQKKNKKLILHIGTHKTGTTALQNFCMINYELLKKYDIDYLPQDTIWGGHHNLGWAFRGNAVAIEKYCNYKDVGVLNHLKSSIENSSCSKILLSSENFFLMDDKKFAKLFFDTFKDYNIKVLVYLREQSDFLESWYYELVRADYCCLSESFEEFIKNPRYELDYFEILFKWMKFIGKDNIEVISYSEVKKHNLLYFSFLNYLGVNAINEFKLPNSTNERVNYTQLLEILEINKKGLELEVRNELVRNVIMNKDLQKLENISFIDNKIKSNITNKYFSSNKKLKELFNCNLNFNAKE